MVQAVDHAKKLYGNSKPKFEPELRVETRPVKLTNSINLPKGHSYFVYRDEDGKEWAYSATHDQYPSSPGFKDVFLVIDVMPIQESIDSRKGQTPEQRGSRVLMTGTKAREGWRDLIQLKGKIDKQKFEYDHEGINSNSVTSLGLRVLGFDPANTMPENEGYWRIYQGTHPGVDDLAIDKDGNVYETPIIDFVKTKQQIDNFAKGFETTIEQGWDRTNDKAKDLWDKSITNLDKSLDKFLQTPQYFEDRIMNQVQREIARQR
ncbi:hypothetical protein O4H49_03185 [Kiloniella laminariae]|uniref:Uncharacterized protein n=1 Tax=Kiloniella laminariae TaxID=454162 RepID=A0ABT4LF85_9PROT|nr:hypothetical protein [Kiloniella laminariae]MCZ4279767.1 hypothetical protein [Kiloniella laminariae]